MKAVPLTRILGGTLALALGGCQQLALAPARPHVVYPFHFEVAVGGAALPGYGAAGSVVTAVHPLAVLPGRPIYYQVLASADVTVFIYQSAGKAGRTLLEQKQGKSVSGSLTPTGPQLEFAFGAVAADDRFAARVTIADEPIPGPPPPPPALRVD